MLSPHDCCLARSPGPICSCGFPDFATRAFVKQLHDQLALPVFGLADLNPFGLSVLATYRCASMVVFRASHEYRKPRFP
jgi:DNA topoisomerase VI subunit A